MTKKSDSTKTIATNRRARHDFEIIDTVEAGLVLRGSEVKSLRDGRANLKDGYGFIKDGEAWLLGVHISPYSFSRGGGHEPDRSRKLLLHKREILRLAAQIAEKGYTLIPLRMYFKEGKAKVELGLGRGKTRFDKRETLKRKQADREMQRAMRHRSVD